METFTTPTAFTVGFEKLELESSRYFIPAYARHRPACRAFLEGRYFEPKTHALMGLLLHSWPGSVVHAGTFFGDMLPSFAAKSPSLVYAFEPVLENYVLARLCIEHNALKNVALFNSALGASIGVSFMATGNADGQHRGGSSQVAETGQITTCVSLDSFSIDDLAVIQLDVEGSERAALQGAQATIRRNSPVVLIEDNNGDCDIFLDEIGYERVGDIPGLTMWAPFDKAADAQRLLLKVNTG